MIGIFLIIVGEFFTEVSTLIGKYENSRKLESIYAMGFLHAIWATLFMMIFLLFQGDFVFSLASLPTFLVRAIFEITLVFVTLNAVIKAEPSTFSFLRVLTIPFLLVVDIFLGYTISFYQILGISAVCTALLLLFLNHGLSKKGKILSVLSALLSVGTVSLYKYNITNYNSVAAEQILMTLLILVVLLVVAWVHTKENLFKALLNKIFMLQSLSAGVAFIFMSFAISFAPASILITAKRSLEIFFAMVFGHSHFHEKHIGIKIVALALVVLGIGLMFI